jgi:uracil-DNA glycosylase
MKMSIFLKDLDVHPSWSDFLYDPMIQRLLLSIEEEVGHEVTPLPHNVLRFGKTDLEKMICTIWGRDPYPQLIEKGEKKGELVATGRSFEVNGATSWNDKSINRSLVNIVKLLHKSYFLLEESAPIDDVRKAIQDGAFPILPPHQAFDDWEKKGVLFLNRAFTCKVGNQKNVSGSHEKIWTAFFNHLLAYMVERNPNMKHFLWGTSREFSPVLIQLGAKQEHLYISKHPSAYVGDEGGYQMDGNFLNNPCFYDTMNEINWM